MKKNFLTILMMAILPIFGNSQDEGPVKVYNFIFNKGDIYWQKVYNIDSRKCEDYFSDFTFIKLKDNKYQCEVLLTDYSEEKKSDKPHQLFQESKILFTLEIKENRYRVTIYDIIWKPSMSTGFNLGSGLSAGPTITQIVRLKEMAYTKKGKRKWEPGEEFPIQINIALENLFNAETTRKKIEIFECDF